MFVFLLSSVLKSITIYRAAYNCSGDYRDEVTMVVSAIHFSVFSTLYFLFVVSVVRSRTKATEFFSLVFSECTCNADLLSSFRRVAAVRTDASANFALF